MSETQRDADIVIVRAAWQHEGSLETIASDVSFHRRSTAGRGWSDRLWSTARPLFDEPADPLPPNGEKKEDRQGKGPSARRFGFAIREKGGEVTRGFRSNLTFVSLRA